MKRAAMIERLRARLSGAGAQEARERPGARAAEASAGGDEAVVASFITRLSAQGADVIVAGAIAELPQLIGSYLAERGGGLSLAVGADARFQNLDWGGLARVSLSQLRDGSASVGLSHAFAGVAETGSLVLASGADNPATLALLPETHVVALERSRVFARYEMALGALQRCGELPRAITLVSGPSRTGDIGGRIVLGAHGPRRLAVVLYR